MNEEYDIALDIILSAGNSKSNSMKSIKEARNFRFDNAEEMLKEAQKDIEEAHKTQTTLIQKEAVGEEQKINLIMIHSQDHITMALMALENAKELLEVYKMIFELKNVKED